MNRALLVGINQYPGAPLNGCVNDITDMAQFLVSKCNFQESDVRLLTDSRATTQGILERLGWLLNGLRSGDRVLFHYSGHGAQMPTRTPQGEVDGLDEVICPVDFDWTHEHVIKDKDFNRLFATVSEGVEFVWISDSCHSGDLSKAIGNPHRREKFIPPPPDIAWRIKTAKKLKIRPLFINRSAAQLNVALISGCKSDQTSTDAYIKNRYNGALTYYLLDLLKGIGFKKPLTKLIPLIRKSLKKNGYEQIPQLEGSRPIMSKAFLKN